MPISEIKAIVQCDRQRVWEIVTDVSRYANWRSDVRRTEVLNSGRFLEYTKSGFPTTFTTTLWEPYSRWEFDMDNSNMSGHWIGVFSQDGDHTTVSFTEDVTVKKWFLKPFVKSYLKKQQEQFVADLEKASAKNGNERTFRENQRSKRK